MTGTFTTCLQLFGIGFSIGIAGPCFLTCAPILITYVVGREDRQLDVLVDIVLFLLGRLFAYIVLGAAAGLGGYYLRRITESGFLAYLPVLSGLISIFLGIALFLRKDISSCAPGERHCGNNRGLGSMLALGFVMGISPCAPLSALLLEITLMSRNAFDGTLYAFSFGLGTFAAGLIIIGALSGILKGLARQLIHSKPAAIIFKILCSALLVILGIGLIVSAGRMTL
ncbi:MAG: sulfite exporter TauE/SafE family protein [Candidatus Omnitrophica bacterium]|nr:sulfite exporter TauE/SafE family protein [Candidatus Omnitrophota bacterium]